MKNALKIALGAILLSAGFAYAQSVYRGDFNLIDNPDGESQYQVGGSDIIKCFTYYCDSLAVAQTVAVFTPNRAIIIKQMDVFTTTVVATDSSTVRLQSTTVAGQASILAATSYTSQVFGEFVLPAGVPCTLRVLDVEGSATGGIDAAITIWYTDD